MTGDVATPGFPSEGMVQGVVSDAWAAVMDWIGAASGVTLALVVLTLAWFFGGGES